MYVAVAKMVIRITSSQSLKSKRKVVRSILDRTRAKFRIAAAEVGQQDNWRSAELGFACVSSEARHAESVIQKVISSVEQMHLAPVVDCDTEIIALGDNIGEQAGWCDEDWDAKFGPDMGQDF
jgi:hypothetical protein